MGVGAVFISTLALTELATPNDPPQNQEELLALYIQPVVAFVVLGSIIIRSYFFQLYFFHVDIVLYRRSFHSVLFVWEKSPLSHSFPVSHPCA